MKERDVFLCIATLSAAALGFAGGGAATFSGEFLLVPAARDVARPSDLAAVLVLAVAVLVCAALLSRAMRAPHPVAGVLSVAACVPAVICSPSTALPLIAVTAVSVLCDTAALPALIAATSAICAAGVFVLSPDATLIAESALTGAASIYVLTILGRRDAARREADERGDRVEVLRERVNDQSRLAKNMGRIFKLEERNRLAARIHDEIGHGMSGSILLLEGADMIMDDDPARARETLRRVTENLRESTDKIRAVLREERSDASEVNIARIRAELALFEANHPPMRAALATEGDMDGVGSGIWACVMDNMLEAMTNTLKHSDATAFNVSVMNSNKLLTVEISDDGSGTDSFGARDEAREREKNVDVSVSKGMGLQNMEERCALTYGRCFFRHGSGGFRVVMTFPQRG
ncbi:MAG: histidine kinase [Clostridiales Family XIII bacterium]|jgi:signal transduction histidine kinase|nr:histidine kinase [Clostridiales Family XIII bacterium]